MKERLRRFQISTPDVECLRILVLGPVGAGKSSFINSIDSIFQERMTGAALAAASTDHSFTKRFEIFHINDQSHDCFLPFALCDIMGLEGGQSDGVETQDLINILKGHIKGGYMFNPVGRCPETHPDYNRNPRLGDRIHCLVSVIPTSAVTMMEEAVINKMRAVRDKASHEGIPQVAVLTKVEQMCPLVAENIKRIYRSKKIKEKMEECSNRLGIPMNCIFPVKNYSEEIDLNDEVDILLLSALKHILNIANDHVTKRMAPPPASMRSSRHQHMDTEDSSMEHGHHANIRRGRPQSTDSDGSGRECGHPGTVRSRRYDDYMDSESQRMRGHRYDDYMDSESQRMGHGHPANVRRSTQDQQMDSGDRSREYGHPDSVRKGIRQSGDYEDNSNEYGHDANMRRGRPQSLDSDDSSREHGHPDSVRKGRRQSGDSGDRSREYGYPGTVRGHRYDDYMDSESQRMGHGHPANVRRSTQDHHVESEDSSREHPGSVRRGRRQSIDSDDRGMNDGHPVTRRKNNSKEYGHPGNIGSCRYDDYVDSVESSGQYGHPANRKSTHDQLMDSGDSRRQHVHLGNRRLSIDSEDSSREDGHSGNRRSRKHDQYVDSENQHMGHGHPANRGSTHDQCIDSGDSSREYELSGNRRSHKHDQYVDSGDRSREHRDPVNVRKGRRQSADSENSSREDGHSGNRRSRKHDQYLDSGDRSRQHGHPVNVRTSKRQSTDSEDSSREDGHSGNREGSRYQHRDSETMDMGGRRSKHDQGTDCEDRTSLYVSAATVRGIKHGQCRDTDDRGQELGHRANSMEHGHHANMRTHSHDCYMDPEDVSREHGHHANMRRDRRQSTDSEDRDDNYIYV